MGRKRSNLNNESKIQKDNENETPTEEEEMIPMDTQVSTEENATNKADENKGTDLNDDLLATPTKKRSAADAQLEYNTPQKLSSPFKSSRTPSTDATAQLKYNTTPKSSPFKSPKTPSNSKDIVGFVGVVTPIKANQARTRNYFTVHLKVASTDFHKIIVSNHRQIRAVRQQFLDGFHNKELLQINGLGVGRDVFFFNLYSSITTSTTAATFSIDDCDEVAIQDIQEDGLVLSVKGKIKFAGEVKEILYEKDGRQRSDKMKPALISDGTRTLEIRIWGDMIELINEGVMLQLVNLSARTFDEQLGLSTNFGSSLCYLSIDADVTFDPMAVRLDAQEQQENVISSPTFESIKVDQYVSCRNCRAKLEIVPGAGLYKCTRLTCSREFLVDRVKNDSDINEFSRRRIFWRVFTQ